MVITEVDFRNYAWDILSIDAGTPSGLGQYVEWLEELIFDDERLNEVKRYITTRNYVR